MDHFQFFRGVWIPAEVACLVTKASDDRITIPELGLLLLVESMVDPEGDGCYATNKRLAKWLGVSSNLVTIMISKLSKRGLLKISHKPKFDQPKWRFLETSWSRPSVRGGTSFPHTGGMRKAGTIIQCTKVHCSTKREEEGANAPSRAGMNGFKIEKKKPVTPSHPTTISSSLIRYIPRQDKDTDETYAKRVQTELPSLLKEHGYSKTFRLDTMKDRERHTCRIYEDGTVLVLELASTTPIRATTLGEEPEETKQQENPAQFNRWYHQLHKILTNHKKDNPSFLVRDVSKDAGAEHFRKLWNEVGADSDATELIDKVLDWFEGNIGRKPPDIESARQFCQRFGWLKRNMKGD